MKTREQKLLQLAGVLAVAARHVVGSPKRGGGFHRSMPLWAAVQNLEAALEAYDVAVQDDAIGGDL